MPVVETPDNSRSPVLQRDLRSMLGDGAAFSVMVGIGETYVPAFAIALGLGDVAVGMVATVPMLAGGLLQLASPWLVRTMGSHRGYVVTCASCQALSLLLLVVLALVRDWPAGLVFIPVTLYWGAGLATGPAWNAWVERLVPVGLRPTFFAKRTTVSQVCVLLGIIGGGLILENSAGGERSASVFASLFILAAIGRFFSAAMLARQSEPADAQYLDQIQSSYRDALRGMRGAAGTKLVMFLLVVQAAVYLSGPYFTPFMFNHLKLTYLQYMVLVSCSFLGKIVTLPWAGRFARRHGAVKLLWIGSVGIVPLAGLWLVSNEMPFLLALQFFGGMTWAAYELAMLLLFFETIPREQRVTMLSLYNAGNAAAMVFGALLGAAALHTLGGDRSAYLTLFVMSSTCRAFALLLIPRHPASSPHPKPPTGMRTMAVRPQDAGIDETILPALPESKQPDAIEPSPSA